MSLIDRIFGRNTISPTPILEPRSENQKEVGQEELAVSKDLMIEQDPPTNSEIEQIMRNEEMINGIPEKRELSKSREAYQKDEVIMERLISWCRQESRIDGYAEGRRYGEPEFLQRGKEQLINAFLLEVRMAIGQYKSSIDQMNPEVEPLISVGLETRARKIELRAAELTNRIHELEDELLKAEEEKGMVAFRLTDFTNGFRAGMLERTEGY